MEAQGTANVCYHSNLSHMCVCVYLFMCQMKLFRFLNPIYHLPSNGVSATHIEVMILKKEFNFGWKSFFLEDNKFHPDYQWKGKRQCGNYLLNLSPTHYYFYFYFYCYYFLCMWNLNLSYFHSCSNLNKNFHYYRFVGVRIRFSSDICIFSLLTPSKLKNTHR